jgi:hypothetical protein
MGIDTSSCGAANCGCFEIAVSNLPFDALQKDFALSASASDMAGNSAAQGGPTLSATRVRWDVALPTGAGYPKGAPAIGAAGTIYQGTSDALVALGVDGTQRWATSVGTIEGSVAVGITDAGSEFVFFAANKSGMGAYLQALNSDGGFVSTSCAASNASVVNASPALAVGSLGLYATAPFNNDGTAGYLKGFTVGSGCAYSGPLAASAALDMDPGVNVVMKADTLFVPGSDANVRAYRNAGNWNPNTVEQGFPVPVVGSAASFLGVSLRMNGTRLGGGGGSGIGFLFELSTSNPMSTVAWKRPGTTTAFAGAPAAGTQGYFHGFNTNPAQFKRVAFDGQSDVTLDAGGISYVSTSPVIGSGGLVYWVTRAGTLFVTDESLGSILWSAGLGASQVVGSPNLDCNRSGPGGVLYVAATNGHLQSILVDSPKLAGTDWPKWQHDAQNSGNPDFPLNAGCP